MVLAVTALLATPGAAVAQSAGDDQYGNAPLSSDPQSLPNPNPGGGGGGSGGNGGSGGGGGGGGGNTTSSGSSGNAGAQAASNGSGSGSSSSSNTTTGSGTGSSSSGSGETLPATGLPAGVLAALGLLFTLGGRGLRRACDAPERSE